MKALIFLVSTLLLTYPVAAIEIVKQHGNATTVFVIQGPIEEGDAEKFIRFWDEEAYDSFRFSVALHSPGGNLFEGLTLGQFFRKNDIDVTIERFSKPDGQNYAYLQAIPGAECFSACAIAFMGGLNRGIPDGSSIGFHQFSTSASDIPTGEAITQSQVVSALVSNYLREMGASPKLFEQLSTIPPQEMWIPSDDELVALDITTKNVFKDFTLQRKNGVMVASATNPRNLTSWLQRVFEIETLCLNGQPTINLYAENDQQGLEPRYVDGTWDLSWSFWNEGTKQLFGNENIVLFEGSRLLASLIVDPGTAKTLISQGGFVKVETFRTASALNLSGEIFAPSGSLEIEASLRDCI